MTEKADKDLTDREIFLLMLADVTHDTRYYFVFTTNSNCNYCWTYPHDNNPMTDDGNLLQDYEFHGGQEQQFEFRDSFLSCRTMEQHLPLEERPVYKKNYHFQKQISIKNL